MAERTNDFYAGVQYALSMLLQLPDFIFRTRLPFPPPTARVARWTPIAAPRASAS